MEPWLCHGSIYFNLHFPDNKKCFVLNQTRAGMAMDKISSISLFYTSYLEYTQNEKGYEN